MLCYMLCYLHYVICIMFYVVLCYIMFIHIVLNSVSQLKGLPVDNTFMLSLKVVRFPNNEEKRKVRLLLYVTSVGSSCIRKKSRNFELIEVNKFLPLKIPHINKENSFKCIFYISYSRDLIVTRTAYFLWKAPDVTKYLTLADFKRPKRGSGCNASFCFDLLIEKATHYEQIS